MVTKAVELVKDVRHEFVAGHRRPPRSGVGRPEVGVEGGDRVRARRTEERMTASVRFEVPRTEGVQGSGQCTVGAT